MSPPYSLTDRQERIVELAGELAARFAARAATHDPQWSFPLENFEDLHRSGFLRLALPKIYGGEHANIFEMVLAQERLAHGDAGTALVVGMLLNIIGRLRDEKDVWPEPIFAAVCRDIAENGGGINTCVTEPDLGSISRGGVPTATARRIEGGWLVNGRKIFITGAPALRYFVTIVVLPPNEKAPNGEVASAIVKAGAPGLGMEDAWQGSLSLRTCGNFDVTYDNVFVPDDWVVERRPIAPAAGPVRPPSGKGAPGLGPWALTVAAVYLGIGEAACRAACDYANERVPTALGRPIAEEPHVQHWIGQMRVAVEGARAQLYETARLCRDHPDRHGELSAAIAAAKFLCTNAACAATETGLRVAGGFSLTGRLTLERHFRDARAGLFQPPQDDLALGFVGRAALADARRATEEAEARTARSTEAAGEAA
ncbi:MAG: acyl-CoA/acyl-ACP dehydrogenase [Methylobacteriaceae bacterium]|nr:acyl-CoA/acyl-ACP dehydrogenase [Methylobacteriaceae bacterium]